jgi:hypothetical protein
MKIATVLAALLVLGPAQAASQPKDALCKELTAFLSSVNPDEKHSITLYTFWGARKDGDKIVIASSRCEHGSYEPGTKLCAYLAANTSREFPGHTVSRTLNCLVPDLGLPKELEIHSGSFSSSFGSPDRGALIDIELSPKQDSDEMAFTITADGY